VKPTKVEIVGHYAATLSLVEVAAGSLLHAFRIPFSGTLLSLNQGFLLCQATMASRHLSSAAPVPYAVSNVAAVLKSLAPAGKKLGPMLSLSMQGFLYSLGPCIFGGNFLGLSVGMVLLSAWAFIQPFLTYYLFFGQQLFEALAYMLAALEKNFPSASVAPRTFAWIFASFVAGKALVALGLAWLAWRTRGKSNYPERLVAMAVSRGFKPIAGALPSNSKSSAFWLALRDLFRPLFLSSMLVTAAFLYVSRPRGGENLWMLLRPLALGFIFFYFSRTLTLDRWLQKMEQGRFEDFAKSSRLALEKLRRATG
jgi:hypothetical protein